MHVLYLTKDLLFSSRVCGLARDAGMTIDVISSINSCPVKDTTVNEVTALAIIDLNLTHLDIAVAVCKLREITSQMKIIAYGPHVDAAMLAAAERAGCDLVLPRSQFDQRIAAMLRELASKPADDD